MLQVETTQQRGVHALAALLQRCSTQLARPTATQELHACIEAAWLTWRLSNDAVARLQLLDEEQLLPAVVAMLGLCSRVQDWRVHDLHGNKVHQMPPESRGALQAAAEAVLCSLADEEEQKVVIRQQAILQQWQGSSLNISELLVD